MMKYIYTLLFCCLALSLHAQVSYNKQAWPAIEKAATVTFSELGPDYAATLTYLEAPSPDGEGYRSFLLQEKAKIQRTNTPAATNRVVAEPPQLLTDFAGNNSTASTPMDNNLAISNGGQVVSVINSHIAIKDMEGNWIGAATLNNFFSDLGIDIFKFDPKVMYDPQTDRFIIFCLSGSDSNSNSILVAFSQTNDAEGDWNLYVLDGTPFNDNTWTDYPMLALTNEEIFLTGNLVIDGLSWQLGFAETLCWQINKNDGYNGDPLTITMWSDFELDGQNIRNICPIKYADENLGDKLYLLSNRNFAMETDTVFFMEITGPQSDPNTTVNIEVLHTSQPYGLAPDAMMEVGSLATNDSRVLDGIVLNDKIQYVHNCRDLETGQAAIYHGYIDNISTTKDASGYIINGGVDDIGYPSMSWTGLDPADEDAIIVVSHSSNIRYPGCSALYVNNDREHSSLVTIKEGLNYISIIQGQGQERWGDYSGNQRKFDEPGTVWVSSSFGEANGDNDTWIGQLARPDLNVAVKEKPSNLANITAYPNPTAERITIKFDIQKNIERLTVQITDINGKVVEVLHNDRPKKSGAARFEFNTAPLASGQYFAQIIADGQEVLSKGFVVQ